MKDKIELETLHLDDKTAYLHTNYQGRMYSEARFFMVYIADRRLNNILYKGVNGNYVFSEGDTRKLLREGSIKSKMIIEERAWERYRREVSWR